MINLDPATTVAFTGHRTYLDQAHDLLAETIRELYAQGFRTFLSGMAVGFDMAAAEAVVELRGELCDVRLVCVVPFGGQDARYSASDRERYRALLCSADGVDVVCDGYRPECYALRNDRLVASASVVVAWYDGSTGGTRYTIQRAMRAGHRVVMMKKSAQLELF